jgi:pimeloyl-ACP methyl ester carboxylesterase
MRGAVKSTLLCIAVLLELSACSNASQRPAQQSVAQQATPPPLRWAPCPEVPNAQCAGLPVPLDPANAGGATLTLRIAKLPAIDQSRKKGMLLFIPGGPGVGIDAMFGAELREAQHIDELRREYDVVTFDPRGIGQSDPIRCAPDAVPSPQFRPPGPLWAPNPPTASGFKAIADANAKFFKSCSDLTGDLMRHLSATDTANDIEWIRSALTPTQSLVAYAGSYGTQYAQAYLELFGNRIRSIVLDGVVDHSIDLPTFSGRNVESASDAFDRFSDWCDGNASCALHGQDVGDVYESLYVKVPEIRVVVSQLLAAGPDPHVGWPAIAKMLAQVNRGDTSALKSLEGSSSLASTSQDPAVRAGKNGLFAGVICSDYGPQNDYDALVKAGALPGNIAPRFIWKYWDAWPIAHATLGVLDCAGWPWPASNPPHKLSVGSRPGVMVANPTHDPATPLANALSVWLQIPQAHLLIADVDGHQSWILSRCAFETEWRFLDDPSSAESTTLCPR